MSKIVVIGDVHGRAIWRKIVAENPDADRFIFLGDYFDSHEKKYYPSRQAFNFKEILKFQEEQGFEKVVLLLGNHDYHYLNNSEKYSGYNQATYFNVTELLRESLKKGGIKLVHIEDGFLFSHAGVTNYWLNEVSNVNELEMLNTGEFDMRTLAWNALKGYDLYGDTISNSPIWVRPASLVSDPLEGFQHVVGHTAVGVENMENSRNLGDDKGIWLNDMLPHHYLTIVDGKPEYKEITFETVEEMNDD